ncbi:hypothetical protein HY251_10480, partial [bacterium]|nr:hypothetical protein [bacterium]
MERTRDFAEVAIACRCITPAQAHKAQRDRRRAAARHPFLAELLLERGAMSLEQLMTVMHLSGGYRERSPGEPDFRFGDVAVRMGYIPQFQLFVSLQAQRDEVLAGEPRRPLGEILVETGRLTPRERDDVLRTLRELEGSRAAGRKTADAPGPLASSFGRSPDATRRRPFSGVPLLVRAARAGSLAGHCLPGKRAPVRAAMEPASMTTADVRAGLARDAAEDGDLEAVLVVDRGGALIGTSTVSDLRDIERRAPLGRCMERPRRPVAADASVHQ